MQKIGNQKANSVWEKNLLPQSKIEPNASTSDREKFIDNKYVRKAYLAMPQSSNAQLLSSIRKKDFDQFYRILPSCVRSDLDIQYEQGKTIAHIASINMSSEFLLLLIWVSFNNIISSHNFRIKQTSIKLTTWEKQHLIMRWQIS
jgi:hypothetical protein